MLKCVIFDMDGTIADTLPLCIAAFRRALEGMIHRVLTDREIIDTFGPSEEGTIALLAPGRVQEGTDYYLRHYEALHGEMCPAPFDGVPELMDFAQEKGLALALVTGKGARSLDVTLEAFGMADTFAAVETGRASGPCKPDGLRRVLERLGLAPDEAVYIGDSPSDVDACRKVGVPILGAGWAATTDIQALAAKQPDTLCMTVDEARAALETLLEDTKNFTGSVRHDK